MFRTCLRLLTNAKPADSRRLRPAAECRQRPFRPRIERLEDRRLLANVGVSSLILGDYVGANGHKNLETVVQEGSNLNYYFRDADTLSWTFGATITTTATGPGSLILGDYVGANGHRNLEVVVQEGSDLNHYFQDADSLTWGFGGTVTATATGPGSLILGDHVGANGHRNLEVVVQEGRNLDYYTRDAETLTWEFGSTVTATATGPGSLILGDYVGANGHRNLEVVVQEGSDLNHYFRDADSLTWGFGGTVTATATGPGSLILGDHVGANGHRNLEVVVQEGSNLNHYYRDADTLNWSFGGTVTTTATGPASLLLGDFSDANGHSNLEVVATECGCVNHYFRDDTLTWVFGGTVTCNCP